ncbi:hypothetical protein BKA65DRAFT_561633 [Rhexocercosporidium sp. MPI-PUGE-AT-0058]|nr:hypothetical protein BKA65DRAFT_561633 [Rhexocercosporidium sp. MPI-PUGE-AT-0058]
MWIFNLRRLKTCVSSPGFSSQIWFRCVSRMSFNTVVGMHALQQVVEDLDARNPAEFPHQNFEPPAQLQFDEFYHVEGMASESTSSTQPDGTKNIPQRPSTGRSASMAQSVHKTARPRTQQEWESYKELICDLYIHRNFNIQQIRTILQEEWALDISMALLKHRMVKWGFPKYIKPSEMSFIVAKAKQQAELGKETVFRVRGSKVSDVEIKRSMRQKMPQELEVISPIPDTPPHIWFRTPSPEPLPGPQTFEEQSTAYKIGFSPFALFPHLRELTPRYNEMAQVATVSAQDPSQREFNGDDDVDRVFKPLTPKMCPSPSSRVEPNLGDDLQETVGILMKDEVPFTDSAYKSAPNFYHSPTSQPALVKSPSSLNTDSSAAEGSRGDSDKKTIYSIGSTVDPGSARKYIIELCNDIYIKLRQSVDAMNWSALTTVLPELIKAFAIKLCHDCPSQNSQMSRE